MSSNGAGFRKSDVTIYHGIAVRIRSLKVKNNDGDVEQCVIYQYSIKCLIYARLRLIKIKYNVLCRTRCTETQLNRATKI